MTVLLPRVLRCHNRGLGSCAFDRLYLRNHYCFLLLLLLRCFSSQGSLLSLAEILLAEWVAPFGNPRVNGYLPLVAAYRSLSRPSSPPRAKASFMCPCLLSLMRFFDSEGKPSESVSVARNFQLLLRSIMSMCSFRVVLGRVELPTSTLSV